VRPAVDVFVPNRNYAQWLPSCLDSLLAQEGVDLRVLVVDNASKDDSVEVVERYRRRDARVQLLRHEQDEGLLTSLNEGLQWCRAPYAMNLSADDALTPGALARATRLMTRRPEVGFVYGTALLHDDGTPLPKVRQYGPVHRVWDGRAWVQRCARTGKNPVFSPEAVMRTSLAQDVGFSPELQLCPDFGMWLGLAARAPVGHLTGARQAVYRLHPLSMMHTQGWTAGLEARWHAFELVARDPHLSSGDGDAVLHAAARAMAVEAVRVVELHTDWGRRSLVPADELLALAQRLWPGVVTTSAWSACRRAEQRSDSHPCASRTCSDTSWSRRRGSERAESSAPEVVGCAAYAGHEPAPDFCALGCGSRRSRGGWTWNP
jgi:glycosyltransferase involved in cell wall biosynthesis